MVHRVSTPPNKHHVNRLYVHRKYGVETKEPTTSAATVDKFVHRHQWMDRHGGRESLAYHIHIGMKRACVSRRGGGGAEGEVLAWRPKARQKLVNERTASTWSHCTLLRP
jgi:hypothetical protein